MFKKGSRYRLIAGVLLFFPLPVEAGGQSWQEVLQQQGFDIVETFDQLRDWSPGGQWYSGAGCAECASNKDLPVKLDGSRSIWGTWNSKGLSFQYTPAGGAFAPGDVITGVTSGTTATVRRVWKLGGKSYIQLTHTNSVQGRSTFVGGEAILSGSKRGVNLQWPLFIADHGPDYTWGGRGKSLVMDLGDNDNSDPANPTMAGLGAQRLGAFLGDGNSGKSGYRKIHAFFMMKISPTFFSRCLTPDSGCLQGGYEPVNVVKVFDINSGFTRVSQWGSRAEAGQVSAQHLYRLPEYGLNFSIFNLAGGGISFPKSLFFSENNFVASQTPSGYGYTQITPGSGKGAGTDIAPFVVSGEWFGVEVASDIGTLNTRNGSTDLWIYDINGVEHGHYSVVKQNRLQHFDHYYNKFVLGGNRLSGNGKTGGNDVRWWVDDVIIDDSRIGPKYFKLFQKFTSSAK